MDPFGISERVVQFSIDRVVGYLVPSQAEREAAFELLVELSTRTTVAPLASDQGSLREALSSIYLVFDKTRVLLRKHGIEVAKDHHDGNVSFGVLAVRVLNDVLRPTLSKWHPQLEDWEALRPERMGKAEWERRWKQNGDCRKELDALREGVRAYIDTLGRISGAPGLAAAALPLPASRPLGQEVVAHGAANVDLGADVPRRRMVHWFELGQLVRLAGALARKARRSPTDDTSFIDRSDRHGEFWFDYVADLGDGFDPTMAVAWQLGRTRLDLPVSAAGDLPQPPDSLPRGELLVFGGDTVYPYASADNYLQQVVLPYRLAWAPSVPPGPRPTVVAIPGNHDWIGGINHFEDIFVVKPADEPADDLADGSVPEPGPLPFADHWDAWQRARWFAVKLPHGWWLWGVDTGLHNQISKEQQRYFEAISESVQEGDRIVLCTPVPLWQLRQKHDRCYFDLRSFLDRLVRGRQATMPLFLAGDSHFFAHYRRSDGGPAEHHVTAGGGGAFLHPTNNLVETIPYERGQPEYSLTRRWPSADDSRGLQPRLRGVLTRQFLSLVPLVAALHLLFAAAVTFDATVGAGTRDPDPHSVWWASVTWTIRAWPGWIVLLAALLIGFVVTRPNSDEVWLTAGARKWGLVHGAVQALIVLLAAVVGRWRGP
ncbi:MAG: hypothetical protein QOE93_1440, partial [Actinomycetota bacterium]|nr:hypothetical protein [Actinomycetota bacterium]